MTGTLFEKMFPKYPSLNNFCQHSFKLKWCSIKSVRFSNSIAQVLSLVTATVLRVCSRVLYVLKVWSPNQHPQYHLGTCSKYKLLGPTQDLQFTTVQVIPISLWILRTTASVFEQWFSELLTHYNHLFNLKSPLPSYFFFTIIIYFIFLAALHVGSSLVAASGGYSSLRWEGFSLPWLLLYSTGFRACRLQ